MITRPVPRGIQRRIRLRAVSFSPSLPRNRATLQRRNHEVLSYATAKENQFDGDSDGLFGQYPVHVVDTRDRRTPDADEQIASRDAREPCRAARVDTDDEHRARRREVIAICLPA